MTFSEFLCAISVYIESSFGPFFNNLSGSLKSQWVRGIIAIIFAILAFIIYNKVVKNNDIFESFQECPTINKTDVVYNLSSPCQQSEEKGKKLCNLFEVEPAFIRKAYSPENICKNSTCKESCLAKQHLMKSMMLNEVDIKNSLCRQ